MTRLSAFLLYCINTLPIIYEKDHIRLLSIYFCSIINLFNNKIAETYCIKSPPVKRGTFILGLPTSFKFLVFSFKFLVLLFGFTIAFIQA